jgi:N-acylglucosamine 2-epimerase
MVSKEYLKTKQALIREELFTYSLPFWTKYGPDKEYGGIYHFIACDGLDTKYPLAEGEKEPQMALVLGDWGSKLWWVHSEALYTTLLMYDRTGDEEFRRLFHKVFDYTYATFPNPDPAIREWIQIRTREGKPQEKVVALPVKDPYHIIRNVALIIELLEKRLARENG